MRKILLFVPLLFLLAAVPGRAQKLSEQPGYVPIEQLDLFPTESLSVEVNLEGAVLKLIAAGAKGEDPALASLIDGLKAIHVRVAPLKDMDEDRVRTKIGHTIRWLEDRGWTSMVRVREQSEEAHMYLKEVDGKISGLTLLAISNGEEAVVVNIVGWIDPDQLGRLSERLHIEHLDKVPPVGKKQKPE